MKEEAIKEIIEAYNQLIERAFEVSRQWRHHKIPVETIALIKETRDCLDVLLEQIERLESCPDNLGTDLTHRINQIAIRLRNKWEELQNEGELP